MATISTLVPSCLHALQSLNNSLVSRTPGSGLRDGNDDIVQGLQPSVNNELGRFRVWSTNLGAHRTGKSSLDYRLRDASDTRGHVVNLLNDLLECLEDAASIANGTVRPGDNVEDSDDSDSDSDSDGAEVQAPSDATELSQIIVEASVIINCLFRLSVSIHNPAPHDRFRRSALTDTSHFEAFDTAHIQHKFPSADEGVFKQLGKANSFRRQFFRYREEHHRKLAHGLPDERDDTEQPGRDDTKTMGVTTVASSLPQHLQSANFDGPGLEYCDARSEAGRTETSFAPSSVLDGGRSRIPSMPEEAGRGPFECPFCYRMVQVDTTQEWRKHVLGDLRPYICLYPDCSAAGQDFQRRHQWIQHVHQAHWKISVCHFGCKHLHIENISALDAHITTSHKDLGQTVSRETLIQLAEQERPLDAAKTCELCNEELESFKLYSRHVGRHQEDLALFVLPDRGLDADTDQEEGFGEDEKPGESDADGSDHARMDPEERAESFTRSMSPASASIDQSPHPDARDMYEERLRRAVRDAEDNFPAAGTSKPNKLNGTGGSNCKINNIICSGEEPCRQCIQAQRPCINVTIWQRASSDQGPLSDSVNEELTKTDEQDKGRNDSQAPTPNRPRERTSTCNTCRIKRIKCSGESPCRQCVRSGRHCTYQLREQPGRNQGLANIDLAHATSEKRIYKLKADSTRKLRGIPVSSLINPPEPYQPLPLPPRKSTNTSTTLNAPSWLHVHRSLSTLEPEIDMSPGRFISGRADSTSTVEPERQSRPAPVGSHSGSSYSHLNYDPEDEELIDMYRRADGTIEMKPHGDRRRGTAGSYSETRESYPEDNRKRKFSKDPEVEDDHHQDARGDGSGYQHTSGMDPDSVPRSPETRNRSRSNAQDVEKNDPEASEHGHHRASPIGNEEPSSATGFDADVEGRRLL